MECKHAIINIICCLLFLIQLPLSNGQTEIDHPKIVIVRADDISIIDPAIIWLSNVVIENDIDATYGIIPDPLSHLNDSNVIKSIRYLNSLNKEHFEFATHGYKHEHFSGINYSTQYDLINQATNIMNATFSKPYTFIPPFSDFDENTVKACMDLGYHSISSNRNISGYNIDQFDVDFEWEFNWTNSNVSHRDLGEFLNAFNRFYNSSNGVFFVITLHPFAYLDDNGNLNAKNIDNFEKSIEYMKNKKVEFMTFEKAHKWRDKKNFPFE